jgi:NSS family neurotransmitter:Na+ symporter
MPNQLAENPYTRSLFRSRWIFILAAIGSAAGLGNLWRFPYLTYEYGGAAFVFAYLVCAFLLGLPLLILENGLGQTSGQAAPGALATVNKRGSFRVIGWIGIFTMFTIVTFYIVISGWVLNYVVYAPTLAWGQDTANFFNQYLQKSATINDAGQFVPAVMCCAIVVYILVYLAIRKGTSGLSRIATWVTPIPFVLMTVLAINAFFLPGSQQGLMFFLVPDWSKLLTSELWFVAASQAFFSLSIGTATMFALGSLLDKKENVKTSAITIILGDLSISLISGIAIFGVLGYMAQIKGVPVNAVVDTSFGLAFIALPQALELLPLGNKLFATLFFVSLFALAFTSIVAMMESILGGLMNTNLRFKRSTYLLGICITAFLIGLLYMRHNGTYIMDIVNHFLNYSILTVATIQAIAVGWIYNAKRLRTSLNIQSGANISSLFDFLLKYFIPCVLGTFIIKQIVNDFSVRFGDYEINYLLAYGVGTLLTVGIAGIIFNRLDQHSHAKQQLQNQ